MSRTEPAGGAGTAPAAPAPTVLGRVLQRRLRDTVCRACAHPWAGHPGAPSDGSGTECAACRSERDHTGAPEGADPCSAKVPTALLDRATVVPDRPERWWHRVAVFPLRVILVVLDGLG
ncbi:hypothetical protein [Curtobacterium sp. UCD-KPL2560]|uniref:hypothetical protein n=1 Tax=Curtobacterium sp. UCD-KPL2560 TaxID=1885315 RepID=UPI00114CAF85|nr:hypothetical protein [Curtobacterium sp. UCD-KPL2560]